MGRDTFFFSAMRELFISMAARPATGVSAVQERSSRRVTYGAGEDGLTARRVPACEGLALHMVVDRHGQAPQAIQQSRRILLLG